MAVLPEYPICGRVGLIIGDDGALAVDRSGGLYPWKLGEGPVTILGDEAPITGVC